MNRNFSNYYIILLYCVFNIIIKINGDFKIRIYYNIYVFQIYLENLSIGLIYDKMLMF